jgi:hypothetical protein
MAARELFHYFRSVAAKDRSIFCHAGLTCVFSSIISYGSAHTLDAAQLFSFDN